MWAGKWDRYWEQDPYEFVWSCKVVWWDLGWVEKNTLNKISFTNINSKSVTCYGKGIYFPQFLYVNKYFWKKFPPKKSIGNYSNSHLKIKIKIKISKNCPKCFGQKPTKFVLIKNKVSCGCHIFDTLSARFLERPARRTPTPAARSTCSTVSSTCKVNRRWKTLLRWESTVGRKPRCWNLREALSEPSTDSRTGLRWNRARCPVRAQAKLRPKGA